MPVSLPFVALAHSSMGWPSRPALPTAGLVPPFCCNAMQAGHTVAWRSKVLSSGVPQRFRHNRIVARVVWQTLSKIVCVQGIKEQSAKLNCVVPIQWDFGCANRWTFLDGRYTKVRPSLKQYADQLEIVSFQRDQNCTSRLCYNFCRAVFITSTLYMFLMG